ncbi:ATP-binding protein [Empedobacter tilapiae]|uniref:HAMP domain-containing sensor histidine kinase n=1 Tax=Empedobacter tilapiae TaxID=2491114 RepID=UPI0028D01731|nr:ATP-binding protein [Empedobacter tilapiae]
MKIRVRLTILFTLLTAAILFFFAFIIYYSAKKDREKEFFELLKKEAITKSNLFLKAKVPSEVLHNIYHNNRQTINEVEVAVYNQNKKLLYHDAVEIDFVKETDELFDEIQQKGFVIFYQDKWQVVGMNYVVDGNHYIVTAAALDEYGYSKMNNLLKNIILIYIFSLLLIILSAFFFTNKAINPVKEITNKAKQISASNLDLRIELKSKGDELAELTTTINQMLQRLENSFDAQKNFVSNIAHELRTPLAAIITELEMAVDKVHTNEEYQQLIQFALNDTKRIVRLSNSLLDMAKASYDPSEINFKTIRIDEILLDSVAQIQKNNKEYKIDLNFIRIPEEENEVAVIGNEYLLKVAFTNLIENACKYSINNSCIVQVDFDDKEVKINFINKGDKIDQEDLALIFKPFFRSDKHKNIQGQGIGLPLTKKIVDLHDARLELYSEEGKETIFQIVLKKSK